MECANTDSLFTACDPFFDLAPESCTQSTQEEGQYLTASPAPGQPLPTSNDLFPQQPVYQRKGEVVAKSQKVVAVPRKLAPEKRSKQSAAVRAQRNRESARRSALKRKQELIRVRDRIAFLEKENPRLEQLCQAAGFPSLDASQSIQHTFQDTQQVFANLEVPSLPPNLEAFYGDLSHSVDMPVSLKQDCPRESTPAVYSDFNAADSLSGHNYSSQAEYAPTHLPLASVTSFVSQAHSDHTMARDD